jgi:predicted metal-dependent peptidase
MQIKNIHEKLMESIQQMLIDTKVNLPYYGNFNLFISFHERKDIDTCGVNITSKGMQFYYSPEFLDRMSQKETNFITLHEDFHLLWNHPKRTITGQYDHKLSNIAQDMIINHIIWEDIPNNYVEIPKDPNGRNMTLFVPKEYPGKLIFEELYEWLRDEKEKHDEKKKKNQCSTCNGTGQKQEDKKGKGQGKGEQGEGSEKSQGKGQEKGEQGDGGEKGQEKGDGKGEGQSQDHNHGESGEPCPDCQGSGEPCPDCQGSGQQGGKGQGNGQPQYGPYGKDPKNEKGNIDTYSMDQIFDDLDNNQGQYMDVHMGDEVSEEMRESMVKDAMERLQARGLQAGNVEQTLNKLRKQRKDYLKHIKRSVSNMIFGTKKQKTITKPNRRQLSGLKGNRKIKTKINCILDTSGSMGGTFERVLSYIYRNDIEVNLIEADTEVKWVQAVKSKRKLESIPIRGLGGTCLQPAINYVADNFNEFNTLVLTDGYCDSLDLSKIKGNVLLISIGTEVPITRTNGKVKQIKVDLDDNR